MVAFVLREAQEKAAETIVKAKETFAREKAQRIREERQRILKQFEKLQKEIETKEKIERSNAINQARLRLLKEREEVMASAVAKAAGRLATLGDPKDPKYKTMLQALILQALIKLDDTEAVVNCRKQDEQLVEAVLPAAVQEYTAKTGRTVKVAIDRTLYLPPSKGQVAAGLDFCSGGVVLASHGGRIVCDNTLDTRLNIAYQDLLPLTRGKMFGFSKSRKFFN
jgi:V-type H+-transporting ATPase subunit E